MSLPNTISINDRLGDGGLTTVAVYSEDNNGNVVGLTLPDNYPQRALQTKLDVAMGTLDAGVWPMRMVAMGDSTGNNDDEWIHLLTEGIAVKYTDYTVNYRVFSSTSLQYESITNLTTGSAGLAYFLTGSNAANKRFVVADSATTSITGDIDIRVKFSLNGSLPSATGSLCGKWGAAGTRSWHLDITATGALIFEHSADGTNVITRTSASVLSGTQLSNDIWVRTTLDVDNGAVGNTCTFMYSEDDGATWTNLGAADTKAGTTSIFDGTADNQFIGRAASSITQQDHDFNFYGMRVYASLDGTARVIDIDIGGVYQYDFTTFAPMYDDVGNTVTVAGTYGSFNGSPRLAIYNGSFTGSVIADGTTYYSTMVVGLPDIAILNYGHNDTSDIEYRTDYKALTDALLVTNPDMAIVVALQNRRKSPAVSIYQHSLRMDQVRKLAVSQGFYVLDFYTNWIDADTEDVDGIHPNTTGKLAGGKIAKLHFGVI